MKKKILRREGEINDGENSNANKIFFFNTNRPEEKVMIRLVRGNTHELTHSFTHAWVVVVSGRV